MNSHKTVFDIIFANLSQPQPGLFSMEFSVDSQMRSHATAAIKVGGLAILLVEL